MNMTVMKTNYACNYIATILYKNRYAEKKRYIYQYICMHQKLSRYISVHAS